MCGGIILLHAAVMPGADDAAITARNCSADGDSSLIASLARFRQSDSEQVYRFESHIHRVQN
jgi:hypothetical protein